MAVSKAIVPLLEGEAAHSIQKTLNSANIKPYSNAESEATSKLIKEAMAKQKNVKPTAETIEGD